MMRDLLNVLPDERPVKSLCVVEDPNRKPAGYHVVDRTYDQDVDADLWKEGFFGKKITRYLCLSKSEGRADYVVDTMTVINDRDLPPDGYTVLTHTADSEQKATKKRLLCYRTMPTDKASQAVTDIIVLSKSKKAPNGFTLAGDMNGFLVCFKTTASSTIGASHHNTNTTNSNGRYSSYYVNNSYTVDRVKPSSRNNTVNATSSSSSTSKYQLPYPVTPKPSTMTQGRPPLPLPVPRSSTPALYPVKQLENVVVVDGGCLLYQPSRNTSTLPRNIGHQSSRTWSSNSKQYAATPNNHRHYNGVNNDSQRQRQLMSVMMKQSPEVISHQQRLNHDGNQMASASTSTNATSSAIAGLEGVKFEINPKFKELQKHIKQFVIPSLDLKTSDQIKDEYNYDFRVERLAASLETKRPTTLSSKQMVPSRPAHPSQL